MLMWKRPENPKELVLNFSKLLKLLKSVKIYRERFSILYIKKILMVLENQIKNQENQNDDVEKIRKPQRVGLQLFKTFKIIEIG